MTSLLIRMRPFRVRSWQIMAGGNFSAGGLRHERRWRSGVAEFSDAVVGSDHLAAVPRNVFKFDLLISSVVTVAHEKYTR